MPISFGFSESCFLDFVDREKTNMKPNDLVLAYEATRTRLVAPLLLAFCIVWFCNLDYRSLVRPDEGRYAEISREMAQTGDWVTPRLNGIKYFEKPPLQYWMTAAAYKGFGESEWTARLWTALTGFAGVLAVGLVGARLFGAQAGLYAATVLAGAVLYAVIGHVNTLDMGVTFWLTIGLSGFLLAQQRTSSKAQTRFWILLAWAALGFSFLSKGLIGLALPAAALCAYAVAQRDLSFLRRLHPVAGIGLLLAVALPWVIAVSVANPEFARFFFIHEHFERFLTDSHHRTAPWWFFIPILAAGMLPWTAMLGHAGLHAWRSDTPGQDFHPRRFLLLYAGVIFIFFSASRSKLPAYILPLFPALALLTGDWLARVRGRTLAALMVPVAALALAGAISAPFGGSLGSDKVPVALYRIFDKWLAAGALVLLACSCTAIVFARRERISAAVLSLGGGGLLFVQIAMTGHQALSPSYSAAEAAALVKPLLDPDTPFYSVRTYEHTLPFYLKRTVTLVDYRDELDFGLQQQPELQIPTVGEFETRWRSDRKALAIMGPDVYRELKRSGLPMRLLSEDSRRVLVARP
jgi:4-amino-4-deoxy-L-arabinose transferase-like glycosyltransferase